MTSTWLHTRVTFTETMKHHSKSRQALQPRTSLHDREMAAAAAARKKGWEARGGPSACAHCARRLVPATRSSPLTTTSTEL